MRIVGGKNRGRALVSPKGLDTRPTTDRTREALFNILAHGRDIDFEGRTIIDVFAGSGALGLEALSRGAGQAVFIESDRAALECIAENAAHLGESGKVTLINRDAMTLGPLGAAQEPAMLAFLDPPYGKGLLAPALNSLSEGSWLLAEALVVCEMKVDDEVELPADLNIIDERTYGKTKITFLTIPLP